MHIGSSVEFGSTMSADSMALLQPFARGRQNSDPTWATRGIVVTVSAETAVSSDLLWAGLWKFISFIFDALIIPEVSPGFLVKT